MLFQHHRIGIRLIWPLTWFLAALVIIVVLLASSIHSRTFVALSRTTATPHRAGNFHSLSVLLLNAACRQACFDGIEPGVTALETLKAYWNRLGVTPTAPTIYASDEDNSFYSWTIEDIPPFIAAGRLKNEVSATVYDGVVDQLIVPVTPCISEVAAEFGSPDSVLASEIEGTSYLLYPGLGLAFYINVTDSTYSGRVNAVFLISESSFSAFAERSETERLVSWMDAMSQLMVPCGLAATPPMDPTQ